ncbi:hypothetical protein C5C03_00010 [Clavibacter michiganensis]|uniref:hypothetical protein n=1 Tax=Clavibacter michiganensis TaxID=28447 RepID=UPI000CE86EED|nr:hypothetical protein [Clavibacter michiganensis]PPF91248.1 hypothetical protein C5C03_00010 [Clavibacter michiganensis]PPF99290.1 hypothetical protein C5C05_01815 [Clavibacter michiganensis]
MVKLSSPLVLLAGASVLSSLFAGCTGVIVPDEEDGAISTPSAQVSPVHPAQGLPAGATSATDVPYDVANDAEIRKRTSVTGCVPIDGGWAMTGTITNASTEDATYAVTAFFTTPGATVLATGDASVDAAAQETTGWRVEAQFAVPEDVRCVLRGVGTSD